MLLDRTTTTAPRINCEPMDPETFREHLALLNWGQRSIADHLGVHATTARRWAKGELPIPDRVSAWLVALADLLGNGVSRTEALRIHPKPAGW